MRRRRRRNTPPLPEHYNQLGYSVFLDAFIVGALGGWDPAYEVVIRHLKLGYHSCKLMRRLMVSDAIR